MGQPVRSSHFPEFQDFKPPHIQRSAKDPKVLCIRVINTKNKNRINEISLTKASFLDSFGFRVTNALKGKKIIKLSALDSETGKVKKFYARVDDVCLACGIQPEDFNSGRKDLGQWIGMQNFKIVEKKVEGIFKNAKVPNSETKIQELSKRIHTLDNPQDYKTLQLLQQMAQSVLINENIDQIIEGANRIQKKYKLTPIELSLIVRLAAYVPIENLERELSFSVAPKILLKTFFKASNLLKKGPPSEDIYVKKVKGESYSFSITREGQVILASNKLDEGTSKKVNDAINISTGEAMVKIAVKGNKKVENVLFEEEIKNFLYIEKNPYILNPSKIRILTITKDKKGMPIEKLVYFEKKMSGNGTSIKPHQLIHIAQFSHDLAKGLAFLHQKGVIHGDVKPYNGLIHENRGILIDFGSLVKEGADINSFSKLFLPPEYSEALTTGELIKAHPSLDSYALGMTLAFMLEPELLKEIKLSDAFFTSKDVNSLIEKLRQEARILKPNLNQKDLEIKNKLIDLVEKLMDLNPAQRPSCKEAAEVLSKIPYVKSSDPEPM